GTTNVQSLKCQGIWWFLENTPFLWPLQMITGTDSHGNATYTTYYCQQFTLNWTPTPSYVPTGNGGGTILVNFTLLTTQQMLKIILDTAIAAGAWLQYNPD